MARPCPARWSNVAREIGELAGVELVEQLPRRLGEIALRGVLGHARQAGRDQMRVGVDRPEDRIQGLDRSEQQRRLAAREQAPQRIVDPPGVLPSRTFWPSEPWMRPLGERPRTELRRTALAASFGRSATLTGAGGRSRADLDHADPVLRQREHERLVREGDRAQQRLEVEPIGDLDGLAQPVRQPIEAQAVRRGENGEAVSLEPPELVVVDEVGEVLLERRDPALVEALGGQLAGQALDQVLERDPVAAASCVRGVVGRNREAQMSPRAAASRRSSGKVGMSTCSIDGPPSGGRYPGAAPGPAIFGGRPSLHRPGGNYQDKGAGRSAAGS